MKFNALPVFRNSFIYDFEVDGGAIGTIGMGIFVREGSLLGSAVGKVILGLQGGKISIGIASDLEVILNKVDTNNFVTDEVPIGTGDLPIIVPTDSEILVTLYDDPVTEGAFTITLTVQDYVI